MTSTEKSRKRSYLDFSTQQQVPTSQIPSQETSRQSSSQKSKKQKLQASYASVSPFPQFSRPTEAEARDVYRLLCDLHSPGGVKQTEPDSSSNSAQTCGKVPNVIEALIGTILSQNTSGQNCARAKSSLDQTFGKNNFSAIVDAPHSRLVEAIRVGGLANKKAKTIQKVLTDIYSKHGDYSLQHLASTEPPTRMSDAEIMQELISYDGVGPKTASCVLLFCLGRHSFAVDTHVFRISKMLGWIPQHADRVLAQAHLDLRIPDDIKYGLHVLMVQHGRSCKGCKSDSCLLRSKALSKVECR